MHRLFEYAIRHHGFCSRDRRHPNPASAVERRREPAPEIRFLTLDQIEEQIEALKGFPVLHAAVSTCIYTGLRREEVTWLTREDVDLELRLIRVRAKTIGGKSWQPKTRRNRVVPISETLFTILREYRPREGSTWLFPSPEGKKWDPDNLSSDLRAVNRAKGLVWGCGDFRHTFGSQLEAQSYPPRCRLTVYQKAVKRINYYQRRNRQSRKAARRTTLRRLHQLGIKLGSLKSCVPHDW